MPVAVIGATGQLGRQVPADFHLARPRIDLTRPSSITSALDGCHPDGVILTAAYTDVDGCETNREQAFAVNAEGPGQVAAWCEQNGAWLLFVSTNCVFDGYSSEPYREEDAPNPISVYGASKLQGEHEVQAKCRRHFIVRTSWLFGPEGNNFVTKILALAERQRELKGVTDEVASPTYAPDLGPALVAVARSQRYGRYHLTNSGQCSRLEYMRAIFEMAGIRAELEPVTLADFQRPSRPPAQSALANVAAAQLGIRLRPWQQALAEYLQLLRANAR